MINQMRKIISITILVLLIPSLAWAKRIHPEKWYQERWCREHKGVMEYVLPDSTRCDCLTETHAVEFDFADKWAEAIGQALHYSTQTGKRAGIVLILESEIDHKYWIKLNTTIRYLDLPIDVWKAE